jgi:hypothetical protein
MTSHPTTRLRSRKCRHHGARTSPAAICRHAPHGSRTSEAPAVERVLPRAVVTIAPPPAQLEIELDEARIAQRIEAIAETDFFHELARKAGGMRTSLRAAGIERELPRLAV